MVTVLHPHNACSTICLQESWPSEDNDTSQIQLDDYECFAQGKSCSSKGGIIIYLLEQFKYVPKLKLNNYQTWEGQVIQIKKGDTLNKPITIGNIYRPPKENNEHYIQFINELFPILNKCEANNNEVIK